MTKYAGRQTKLMVEAHATILDVAAKIGTLPWSAYKDLYNMQRKLMKALTIATFPFICYDAKVSCYSFRSISFYRFLTYSFDILQLILLLDVSPSSLAWRARSGDGE